MGKQNIELKPHNLGITERGGKPVPSEYAGLKRQVRRRVMEIDEQIAVLEKKKASLLK